jgi:hypothetical protein
MQMMSLPRYVIRKQSKRSGWNYYWNLPTWARRDGCPVASETLGNDYPAAMLRVETLLLPAFDEWRNNRTPGKGCVRSRGRKDPNLVQPLIGVYLLLLKGKIVYAGESLNMPKRVAEHRANGRPFDQAYYIATAANQRANLERVLIRAINPPGNRAHRVNGKCETGLDRRMLHGKRPLEQEKADE